jgi:hypothetical protein
VHLSGVSVADMVATCEPCGIEWVGLANVVLIPNEPIGEAARQAAFDRFAHSRGVS